CRFQIGLHMKAALRAHWCWNRTSGAHRRATDGMLPRPSRMGRLVCMVGGGFAWPVAVAIARLDDGDPLRGGSAGRRLVDSDGRTQRGLPGLLLLSSERGTALAGIGSTDFGAGSATRPEGSTAGACRHRRFADQALWPEG